MPSDPLKLILPSAALPAEGCEPETLDCPVRGGTRADELLSRLTTMTRLIGEGAYVLRSGAPAEVAAADMETVTFSVTEDAMPTLTLGEADGDGVATMTGDADTVSPKWTTQAFARALERYQQSCAVAATGSDCERFAESLAISFNDPGEADSGEPIERRVPLLAERNGRVLLYGIWEATSEELELLASGWSGDAASGWLPVGEDDEVEGRGLKEMVFGLTALSLVAGGAGEASANTQVRSIDGGGRMEAPVHGAIDFDDPIGQERSFEVASIVEEAPRPATTPAAPAGRETALPTGEVVDQHADSSVEASGDRDGTDLTYTAFDAPNGTQDGARIDVDRLKQSTRDNTRIVVDVAAQRAYIVVDGAVIGDSPVSTARSGKYTPRGVFHITQKKADKISTLYHCALPYWMRLDQSAIGLHTGELPGHPASAGCIRLPDEIASLLFQHVQSGTAVEVVDAWSGARSISLDLASSGSD